MWSNSVAGVIIPFALHDTHNGFSCRCCSLNALHAVVSYHGARYVLPSCFGLFLLNGCMFGIVVFNTIQILVRV